MHNDLSLAQPSRHNIPLVKRYFAVNTKQRKKTNQKEQQCKI